MVKQVTLGDFIGYELEEDFMNFDLTEIQQVLDSLKNVNPIDIAHAEFLQQKALRGADIICEYLGKIIKTVAYLETKVNSTKNRAALEYKTPDGSKVTADMRKYFCEISPEVELVQIQLAKAKGSKSVLEKKHDILLKSYHSYKDMAAGLRRTVLGYSPTTPIEKSPEGWE